MTRNREPGAASIGRRAAWAWPAWADWSSMLIVSGPLPVRVANPSSDWPGWLSFIAAVLALVIAVVAIVITRRQAIAASRQIAVERRTVFELETLRDLLKVGYLEIGVSSTAALVETLPHADLPLWRTVIADQARWTFPSDQNFNTVMGREVNATLDREGVPPGENWQTRLSDALVDDVQASIAARVEGDQGRPETAPGDAWHGLMGPGDRARG